MNFFAGSQIDDGYKNAFHFYIKYFKKNERDGKRILWEETADTIHLHLQLSCCVTRVVLVEVDGKYVVMY